PAGRPPRPTSRRHELIHTAIIRPAPANVEPRRDWSRPCGRPSLRRDGRQMQRHVAKFALVRYGVAVLSVTIAVVMALWLRPIVLVAAQLLLVAVLITGWVSDLRPALVAWILATLAFGYFFTPPFDSLKIEVAELPRLLIFTALAG